jgi:4-aminobutyrate aminotransferase-like enzyme
MNSGVEACETAVKLARRWGYDVKRVEDDKVGGMLIGTHIFCEMLFVFPSSSLSLPLSLHLSHTHSLSHPRALGHTAAPSVSRSCRRSCRCRHDDAQATVIVARNNFWGRSIAALSASTDPECYTGFGPKVSGFAVVPYNDIPALETMLDVRPPLLPLGVSSLHDALARS